MYKDIPADGTPVTVVNLANTCGKVGVILQNLTSVPVEFSNQQTDLAPAAVDKQLGFVLPDNTAIMVLSPFADVLYAHVNVKGASARIAVHTFRRE